MRDAFIAELLVLAEINPKIVLVVGDLGFGVVEPFAQKFPERFFNAGVAEQNMMGMCAGLASEGFHVFAYSIANFPTFRCAEQIRNDVDYHDLSVTIVAVGGGLAYGNLGYSHHALQDYALMRVMPNMLIAAPGDPYEVQACVRYLVEHPQPSYLRLGKSGEPSFHNKVPFVEPGRWVPLESWEGDGKSILLSTGGGLAFVSRWKERGEYPLHSVFTLPLWGMKTKHLQAEQLAAWQEVCTVEDHIVDAGFGSWLQEVRFQADIETRLELRALNDNVFGQVGSQEVLSSIGGLD